MRCDRRLVDVAMAGREHTMQVAAVRDHPGFVVCGPVLHSPVELAEYDAGVVGEPLCNVRIEPSAAIVEGGRQVPVMQCHHRLDAMLKQFIDEAVVEAEARG